MADQPAALRAALAAPRILIEDVSPAVDGGRFAARTDERATVCLAATVFSDGHPQLQVRALWREASTRQWRALRMHAQGNDRWQVALQPKQCGDARFRVEAWLDIYAGLLHRLRERYRADQPTGQDVQDLLAYLDRLYDSSDNARRVLQPVTASLAALRWPAHAPRMLHLLSMPSTLRAIHLVQSRVHLVRTRPYPVMVERLRARYANWYELFPRSAAPVPGRHGTFGDVASRIPALRAMGFDVLYLPPVHPIGRTDRKGRNNATVAGPDDPGSPYAIGSEEGGHDALHPALGNEADFLALLDTAHRHGMELAMDFAVQCSPDHPWLREHPDWFDWRADGSLRHAENPPKQYQDIVNPDFYLPGAMPALWLALRDILLHWIGLGVHIFRVDNPHTKPVPFWEWLIQDIRQRHPQVIFLAEAFTRPAMLQRLAKCGFSQSYTYFTWRHDKQGLTDFFTALSQPPLATYLRPNLFVNTPDINPYFLQHSGRPGFLIRAALAATGSGLWGMYSGFELCEAAALPEREEYQDSEKYQLRHRDYDAPGNLCAEITALNRLRHAHEALQTHMGFRPYRFDNEQILYFGKVAALPRYLILVAICLDPHQPQEGDFELPLWEFGLPDHGAVEAQDLLSGDCFRWQGKCHWLRLDPARQPYRLWRLQRPDTEATA